MQFGFMPGRGTTDAIFTVRKLQRKILGKIQLISRSKFVDLETAFDRVPSIMLWRVMRVVGVPDGLLLLSKQCITKQRVKLE